MGAGAAVILVAVNCFNANCQLLSALLTLPAELPAEVSGTSP